MKKASISKLLITLFSIIISLLFLEFGLRAFNIPRELDVNYQRKDIPWMEQNVDLNSSGYRDKEYPAEKEPGTLRIYALGDSYTYGWLVDNPEETYPKILEKNYLAQNRKVEVINAGSPGFSLPEMINRFKNEGKYFSPDLIAVGINDDEANFSKNYQRPEDNNYPPFIKSNHLYQLTLGNYYKYLAETINHEYVLKIYTEDSSEEWGNTTKELLKLKSEAEKISAKVLLVLFPHIHPNRPDDPYDYIPYNEKFKKFAQDNGFLLIDPLEDFKIFREKSKLVVNSLDPHPTGEMNKIVADSFIKQFDLDRFLETHQSFTPQTKNATIDQNNLIIGGYQNIRRVTSNIEGYPWVYFETKNGNDIQNFPLTNKQYRNSKIYMDNLQTAKSFTHSALPGATILYHIYPKDPGEIFIPKNIYGYEVIALNHVFALEIRDDGTVMSSYISPSEVVRTSEGFNVRFYNDNKFHVFRINLKVGVKQIDISPEGNIQQFVKSYMLQATQPEKSKTVILTFSNEQVFSSGNEAPRPASREVASSFSRNASPPAVINSASSTAVLRSKNKISSWAEFSGEDTKAYTYAFVEGKMTKVKEIEAKENNIVLKFDIDIDKDQVVEFPVMAQYLLEPGENIQIEYDE